MPRDLVHALAELRVGIGREPGADFVSVKLFPMSVERNTFMPTSSFGCIIFDALIAVWFFAGAPSLIARRSPA